MPKHGNEMKKTFFLLKNQLVKRDIMFSIAVIFSRLYINFMRLLFLFLILFSTSVYAQNAIPEAPDPIQNLIADGAQARYLGNDYGVDAWLTIKNGQEQYFYVMPGGEAFVMGVMFDKKGKLVTVDQVRRLREGGDPALDALTERPEPAPAETQAFLSPAEQMFQNVQESNWITLGQNTAPIAYAFVDPRCPHCHEFVKDVRSDIESGKLQLRLVPVGVLSRDSLTQAAFLLAAPNPAERWFQHLDGDKDALPIQEGLSEQGVMRNMQVMQSWKMDATPIIVYRDKAGKIKIVRGKPKDSDTMIKDIGNAG